MRAQQQQKTLDILYTIFMNETIGKNSYHLHLSLYVI